jgi:hypothetical protein
MRKFKLISRDRVWLPLQCDQIYEGVERYAKLYPEDWEEVTDIKDTDLGYFTGLIYQTSYNELKNGGWDNSQIAVYAIDAAKTLIEELKKDIFNK